MNKHIISSTLFLVLMVFVSSITFAQPWKSEYFLGSGPSKELAGLGIDTTNLGAVFKALDSTYILISAEAAMFLAERRMTDAIPQIRTRFLRFDNFGSWGRRYLQTLIYLGDPGVKPLLYMFVDSIHTNFRRSSGQYSVAEGLEVVNMLVKLGDYTRFNFVLDVFSNVKYLDFRGDLVTRFGLEGDAAQRDQAYSLLLELSTSYPSEITRWTAIHALQYFTNHPHTFPALLSLAENDTIRSLRSEAADVLVTKYPYDRAVFDLVVRRAYNSPLSPTLIPKIIAETGRTMWPSERIENLDRLEKLPFPEVQLTLKELSEKNADEYVREGAAMALEYYIPPKPNPLAPVIVLLDSLIAYKHQVAALGWLGDEHFVKELDNDLENAQKHLAKGDSVNTAKEVEKLQDKIKKEYERTIDNEKKNKPRDKRFVTEEGYKFLFYNAKYIMDRLPRKK